MSLESERRHEEFRQWKEDLLAHEPYDEPSPTQVTPVMLWVQQFGREISPPPEVFLDVNGENIWNACMGVLLTSNDHKERMKALTRLKAHLELGWHL